MRILALETSGISGSVAALDHALLVERHLAAEQRSAQSLSPGIAEVLRGVGWRPMDVELIAVTTGPGSFTGLRVGVTTAKVLAYAVGAQLLGVNTLEVLAHQMPSSCELMETIIDAHRQQLFVGNFQRAADGGIDWQGETKLVDIDHWLANLSPDRWLCGPMLAKLRDRLPDWARPVSEDAWQPRAVTVGQLAVARHASGQRDDIWQLAPFYGRASAAEEKRK